MTNQRYEINILPESIIIGNDAIFKCSIPSFVSDFVFVENWIDSEKNQPGSSMGFGNFFLLKEVSLKQTALKIFRNPF